MPRSVRFKAHFNNDTFHNQTLPVEMRVPSIPPETLGELEEERETFFIIKMIFPHLIPSEREIFLAKDDPMKDLIEFL